MPARSQAQQKYFGAILGGSIKKPKGLSLDTARDFASTPRKGLPKHLADGRKPMTNTAFQQNERVSKSRPEWMETAAKNHAAGKPAPNASGGGHWLASAEVDTPKYRVKKTAVGHMADGKKPEKWAAEAFKPSHKGLLHRELGVPEGKKIPASKMSAALHSRNPKIQHQAQAAKNI